MPRPDRKATSYQYGNGRFDLMTDEEVRTLSHDDLMLLYMVLSLHMDQGSTGELAHQLYELHLRYPEHDFQIMPHRSSE